ncbi:ABC transporter permease [Candidatus Dependentiae bacterium]|nr:ABC transporter permease [Candidatus Dependentiae bacterium]
MKLPFLLASKFILKTDQKDISIMIKICFFSILIGTFSLALVAAIMNGFEKATHEKLQGIHTDILIRTDLDSSLDYAKLSNVLKSEFANEIEDFAPTSMHQLIIRNDKDDKSRLVGIKAIEPEKEKNVSVLAQKLIKPQTSDFAKIFGPNKIILGKSLADSLNLDIGDLVSLLYAQETNVKRNKLTLDKYEAIVSGIFKTGVEDFDENIIITNFQLFNKIFPNIEVQEIGLKLKNKKDQNIVIQKLKKRTGLDVYSWKDLYPAIVSALVLEKYAMIFILALIVLVACMNLISLLFMYITQKRSQIAILLSMGSTKTTIIRTFMILGLLLSLSASLTGLLLAIASSFILQNYPFIKLPDIYYVTHLPAEMDWQIATIVIIISIILSLFAVYLPTRMIKNINIANILKFES